MKKTRATGSCFSWASVSSPVSLRKSKRNIEELEAYRRSSMLAFGFVHKSLSLRSRECHRAMEMDGCIR